ncbi:hypothetical protein MP228_001595 [Amoeboaphelidium protococcarum]|nr:hypothetical protein MP228_001595 [Amoeboaphelidium protococcarum]
MRSVKTVVVDSLYTQMNIQSVADTYLRNAELFQKNVMRSDILSEETVSADLRTDFNDDDDGNRESLFAKVRAFNLDDISQTDKVASQSISHVRRKVVPKIHQENNILTHDLYLWQSFVDNQLKSLYLIWDLMDADYAIQSKFPFYMPQQVDWFAFRIDRDIEMEKTIIESLVDEQVGIYSDQQVRNSFVISSIMDILCKFLVGNHKAVNGLYEKRVNHDKVLDKATYQDQYVEFKQKYGYWVSKWCEAVDNRHQSKSKKLMDTDPQKHVFEDISILTFLHCLFKQQKSNSMEDLYFIDIGCGNGFLTYLLGKQNWNGLGFDQAKRALWDVLQEDLPQLNLQENTIDPRHDSFDIPLNTQRLWLIGNHADELTGWIPLLAHKINLEYLLEKWIKMPMEQVDIQDDGSLQMDAFCSVFVLPCCFFDLRGVKNPFGQSIAVPIGANGRQVPRYEAYLQWTESMIDGSLIFNLHDDMNRTLMESDVESDFDCSDNDASDVDAIEDQCFGLVPEVEHLRIPSTKNIAYVGRKLKLPYSWYTVEQESKSIILDRNELKKALEEVEQLRHSVEFVKRKSDRDKGELLVLKKELKSAQMVDDAVDQFNELPTFDLLFD